jgi:hypothetical protein
VQCGVIVRALLEARVDEGDMSDLGPGWGERRAGDVHVGARPAAQAAEPGLGRVGLGRVVALRVDGAVPPGGDAVRIVAEGRAQMLPQTLVQRVRVPVSGCEAGWCFLVADAMDGDHHDHERTLIAKHVL